MILKREDAKILAKHLKSWSDTGCDITEVIKIRNDYPLDVFDINIILVSMQNGTLQLIDKYDKGETQ